MTDIIDSSYTGIDTSNLLPSFLKWLFSGALNIDNGGIWGVGLLIVVGLGSFLMFQGQRSEKGMMVSSMLTWFISLLALKAGWISNLIFTLCCIYVAYSLYELFKKSSGEEA